MTTREEALTGTYAVLAKFAEAVKDGELSTGLGILAELNHEQRGELINVCIMLLTWQLDTDQALEAILSYIRMSGSGSAGTDDDLGAEVCNDEPEAKSAAPASEPNPAAAPEMFIPPNMKQPVTINLRTALKLRAETAVLRTGHLPGGYRSQVKLIEAALEQELTRLEAEFNNGELFPPNVGSFRTGRPLGS